MNCSETQIIRTFYERDGFMFAIKIEVKNSGLYAIMFVEKLLGFNYYLN